MTEEMKKNDNEEMEEVNSNLEANQEEFENQREGNDMTSLREALKKKEVEAEDYLNRLQRLQADYANLKKRTEKEKSEIYLYANEKIASDLLNIIDNLDRALDSQGEEEKKSSFSQGILMVAKQLSDVLKNHGIEEIEALGKPFDMHLHHAVMREEADGPSDHVIEVFQKGYTIREKVLRPAMVKVSQ